MSQEGSIWCGHGDERVTWGEELQISAATSIFGFVTRDFFDPVLPYHAEVDMVLDLADLEWRVGGFRALNATVQGHYARSSRLRDRDEEVTLEGIRSMPISRVAGAVAFGTPDALVDADGTDFKTLAFETLFKGGLATEKGPTPTNLALVGTLYPAFRLTRLNGVGGIAKTFGLPTRTATHWIKLARERDHFPTVRSNESEN